MENITAVSYTHLDGVPEEVFAQDEVLKKARLQKPSMTQLLERLGME